MQPLAETERPHPWEIWSQDLCIMDLTLDTFGISWKTKEKKNPTHCLKRPWAGTYKAKCFSCRQENAGELARDELVRKYLLPVDTPNVLPLWPTPVADDRANKTLYPCDHPWLTQLQSVVPLTLLASAEPSGFLPEAEDVPISQQERLGLEMWHSESKGRQMCKLWLKINFPTLPGANKT